jgi:hypothetical protein
MSRKSKWREFLNLFQRGRSFSWYVRNAINLVDDPVDALKEWLH